MHYCRGGGRPRPTLTYHPFMTREDRGRRRDPPGVRAITKVKYVVVIVRVQLTGDTTRRDATDTTAATCNQTRCVMAARLGPPAPARRSASRPGRYTNALHFFPKIMHIFFSSNVYRI